MLNPTKINKNIIGNIATHPFEFELIVELATNENMAEENKKLIYMRYEMIVKVLKYNQHLRNH